MKVGDLVILSKYGTDRQYNERLTLPGNAKQLGVIIRVSPNVSYPYTVHWHGVTSQPFYRLPVHSRRELKYAKCV